MSGPHPPPAQTRLEQTGQGKHGERGVLVGSSMAEEVNRGVSTNAAEQAKAGGG